MNKTICAILGLSLLVLLPSGVLADQKPLKEQLVGTWTLVSNTSVRPDGSKTDTFGPNPHGLLMFDSNDHYAVVIERSDLPKFSGKSVKEGTPEEYKTVMQGMFFTFGTYSFNDADKTITTHINGSSFPNLIGGSQERIVTSLSTDELKYRNPTAVMGAPTVELVWKRVR